MFQAMVAVPKGLVDAASVVFLVFWWAARSP